MVQLQPRLSRGVALHRLQPQQLFQRRPLCFSASSYCCSGNGRASHAARRPAASIAAPARGKVALPARPLWHTGSSGRCSMGRSDRQARPLTAAAVPDVLGDALVPLGLDFLTFLAATVLVIPVFKSAKQSPVLGFLFAGVVMGQLGLFRHVEEIEKLSELGVLFLLFEMGLELTIEKLQALAKYAFGLGFLQMLVCTALFTAMALPAGRGIMTQFLEVVLHASPSLVSIRSVDEAVVIGVALSLSSSAFVLQLLRERGELKGQFGQATLGILLAQDLATVPFLVLLPLIEGGGGHALAEGGPAAATLLTQLGPTAAKTLGSLALLLVGGRLFLRRIFELVAESRSEETFVALCLLSVTGASLLTQRMGFSDTLGAFGAGVLLAETNFKTQVEADIQPFRGLLLGLFFVMTGSSLDMTLFLREWPIALTLLAGLLALKITAITALTPLFGLSKADSIRTGFVLAQGGEFAFVLLALANRLGTLPEELNKLLIIVVVLSMALTPVLTEVGKQMGKLVAAKEGEDLPNDAYWAEDRVPDPIVIIGFGDVGQAVANMLDSPLMGSKPVPYVIFDLTPGRVQAAQEAGFNVLYGEGSRRKVLQAAGISRPRAVAIGYTARQRAMAAVETIRENYPDVPIFVRAVDIKHAAELEAAGATTVVIAEAEAGLAMGARMAQQLLGVPLTTSFLVKEFMRQDIHDRTAQMALALERTVEGMADDTTRMQLQLQGVYKTAHSRFELDPALLASPRDGKEGTSAAASRAAEPTKRAVAAVVAAKAGGDGKGLLGKVGAAAAGGGLALANFLQTIDLSATMDDDTGPVGVSRSNGGGGSSSSSNNNSNGGSSSSNGEGGAARASASAAPDGPEGTIACPLDWDAMRTGDEDGRAAAPVVQLPPPPLLLHQEQQQGQGAPPASSSVRADA